MNVYHTECSLGMKQSQGIETAPSTFWILSRIIFVHRVNNLPLSVNSIWANWKYWVASMAFIRGPMRPMHNDGQVLAGSILHILKASARSLDKIIYRCVSSTDKKMARGTTIYQRTSMVMNIMR